MMHHIKKCTAHPGLGLFLIRLAVGVIFINHGIAKLTNIAGTTQFFDMALPVTTGTAVVLAWTIALIETIAGAFMILGVFTCVSGLLLSAIMLVALIFVKSKMPFAAGEIDLILLASSLGIVIAGPGACALEKFCKKCTSTMCNCVNGVCDHCDTCKNGCTGHEVTNK